MHTLQIGSVAFAAREAFRTEVGTIYMLVATSHLQSLATALGTVNRELSITSVSTHSSAMYLTSRRTHFKPLASVAEACLILSLPSVCSVQKDRTEYRTDVNTCTLCVGRLLLTYIA